MLASKWREWQTGILLHFHARNIHMDELVTSIAIKYLNGAHRWIVLLCMYAMASIASNRELMPLWGRPEWNRRPSARSVHMAAEAVPAAPHSEGK